MEEEHHYSPEILEKARQIEEFCFRSIGPALEKIMGIGLLQIMEIIEKSRGRKPKLIFLERDAHILSTVTRILSEKSGIEFERTLAPFTRGNTIFRAPDELQPVDDRMRALKESFLGDPDKALIFFIDSGRHGSVPDFLTRRHLADYQVYVWMVENAYDYDSVENVEWREFRGGKIQVSSAIGLYRFIEEYLTGTRSEIRSITGERTEFNRYPSGSEQQLFTRAAYKGVVRYLRGSTLTLQQLQATEDSQIRNELDHLLHQINDTSIIRDIETDELD